MTTLRPLGPSVTLTVGQLVDSSEDRLTRSVAVCDLFGHLLFLLLWVVEDGKDVRFLHDEQVVLFTVVEALGEDAVVRRSDVHEVLQAVLIEACGSFGTVFGSESSVGGVGWVNATAIARRRS
jgi:hypothetical protein